MGKNKFETLIEYIINDDEAKAKALFHKIVIEKSRDIYESLVEDESPIPDGQEVDSLEDEIDGDETGSTDDLDNDEGEFDGETDLDDDAVEAGDEEGLEDRVMDLEDAIDELKAEFDQLMADEASEEEENPEIHGSDESSDELGSENPEEPSSDEDVIDDDEDVIDDDEDDESGFGESVYSESRGQRKSPSDLMREYVEKVTVTKPVEGDYVGAGSAGGAKTAVNSKSTTIGGKNDMGGTAKNIAQGGSEQVPNGPKKPSNVYAKGEKKMGQDKYENSPGANTKGYADKKSAPVKKEEAGTNDESIIGESRKPRARKPAIKG